MEEQKSSHLAAERWIVPLIFLGLIVAVAMLAAQFSFVRNFHRERARFQYCQAGQRTDCQPSFIWKIYRWNAGAQKP